MFCVKVLVLLYSSVLVTGRTPPPRIMGGQDASVEDYPFMAACERWGSFLCGGSIVGVVWALTAGHCIRGDEQVGEMRVRFGTSNRQSGGWLFDVIKFVTYPTKALQIVHDIALLKVKGDFPIGPTVHWVTLPQDKLDEGQSGTVLGWGRHSPLGNLAKTLQKTTLVTLQPSECKHMLNFNWEDYADTFYCARPKVTGTDTCPGDGGSPFVQGNIQHGILTSGYCLGLSDARNVLTNLYFYREWIRSVLDSLDS